MSGDILKERRSLRIINFLCLSLVNSWLCAISLKMHSELCRRSTKSTQIPDGQLCAGQSWGWHGQSWPPSGPTASGSLLQVVSIYALYPTVPFYKTLASYEDYKVKRDGRFLHTFGTEVTQNTIRNQRQTTSPE